MEYKYYKTVFLSSGVCEFEFYLLPSKKEGFIGYSTEGSNKKYCIVFDNVEYYYDSDIEVLNAKVFDGKSIEEVWDSLVIECIDGLTDDEYVSYNSNPNFYLKEAVADYKLHNEIDIENLINKLKASEYNGNILLYAGCKELKDFSKEDKLFIYYFYDTFGKGIYLLKKENDDVSFNYITNWYSRKKLDLSGTSIGRKYDNYSYKSSIDKSNRYKLMLQYQRLINRNMIGSIFTILSIISIFGLILSIGFKEIYPRIWFFTIPMAVISILIGITSSSIKSKKTTKLYSILFPKTETKVNYTDMFLEIIEVANEGFYELHEELTHHDKKMKMYGGILENNEIDVQFISKKHEFFLTFYNQFVLINIDEETIDKNIKLKYVDYKDYNELEEKIYLVLKEYI